MGLETFAQRLITQFAPERRKLLDESYASEFEIDFEIRFMLFLCSRD